MFPSNIRNCRRNYCFEPQCRFVLFHLQALQDHIGMDPLKQSSHCCGVPCCYGCRSICLFRQPHLWIRQQQCNILQGHLFRLHCCMKYRFLMIQTILCRRFWKPREQSCRKSHSLWGLPHHRFLLKIRICEPCLYHWRSPCCFLSYLNRCHKGRFLMWTSEPLPLQHCSWLHCCLIRIDKCHRHCHNCPHWCCYWLLEHFLLPQAECRISYCF